jgi:Family of unknown function (DUF6084)
VRREAAIKQGPALPARGSVPELTFAVEGAEALPFAAIPTLGLRLRIESLGGVPIRSLALTTQIRIAVTRRSYDPATQERLVEVFGEPPRWGQTLRSLLWTHTTLNVPAFTGSTVAEMPVACTYDFEVVAAKYLHALHDGDVPLELLFSGTIFYLGESGLLRTALISWDKEAEYRLPVGVWRDVMDQYFPDSAWLRLRKETFDRLYAYKAQRALPTWEEAVERLLESGDE